MSAMRTNEGKSPVLTREKPSAVFAFRLRSNKFFVLHLFGHKYNHAHYEPKFTDIRKCLALTSVDFGIIAGHNSLKDAKALNCISTTSSGHFYSRTTPTKSSKSGFIQSKGSLG